MNHNAGGAVEAPSGKDAAYENFPVGSFLLPAALRPHVAVFYAYARAIDDIADSADLPAEEKIARLDAFARVIGGEAPASDGFEKAQAIRRTLVATGISPQHCLDLISAFKHDAVKGRYADWPDLIDYCDRSAAPVGRFLIDLHGGSRSGYGAADALCNALQVINHLQDCQDDYRTLNRVYLPGDWVEREQARIDDLDRQASTPALRRVIDRCLDGIEALLTDAGALPAGLRSRRLAMESAAILGIAKSLTRRLRHQDPLARRVQLGKTEFLFSCVRGVVVQFL
ncbi:MAG: squalene synthase HpnC [Rhodospirillales bacterium]|nr:squalene synthase HpnC [Rhodospirillales bacterium]